MTSALAVELGLFNLSNGGHDIAQQCIEFVLQAASNNVMSVMEVAHCYIEQNIARQYQEHFFEVGLSPSATDAVSDFNTRCRENGVGYAFEVGQIINVNSLYIHTEVTEPAFILLHEGGFEAAQIEFLAAHGHFRRGHWEAAIVEAGKAFESAMKTVCSRKGWAFEPTAQAKNLVAALFKNGFLPPYLETQMAHLRGLLETGVPVVRNKEAAHGRGEDRVEASPEVAEYVLHLTAANLVFLVKQLRAGGRGRR